MRGKKTSVKSFGDYINSQINTGEEKIEKHSSLKYMICRSTNYNKCNEKNHIEFFLERIESGREP